MVINERNSSNSERKKEGARDIPIDSWLLAYAIKDYGVRYRLSTVQYLRQYQLLLLVYSHFTTMPNQ